ncbi:hypothetical protein ERJ75_000700000 [Trypanosoma vivax]|nr:hypothetical protein ERJ75_000700000 [Trypanosoma vivax]
MRRRRGACSVRLLSGKAELGGAGEATRGSRHGQRSGERAKGEEGGERRHRRGGSAHRRRQRQRRAGADTCGISARETPKSPRGVPRQWHGQARKRRANMNRIDTQVMHPAAGRGVGHAVAGQTGREKTGARSCCAGFGNTRGAKGHLDSCAGKWTSKTLKTRQRCQAERPRDLASRNRKHASFDTLRLHLRWGEVGRRG